MTSGYPGKGPFQLVMTGRRILCGDRMVQRSRFSRPKWPRGSGTMATTSVGVIVKCGGLKTMKDATNDPSLEQISHER